MARVAALLRALGSVALALAFACEASPARAQTLVPLHVRSFTLATDRPSVRVGETFHLIVRVHVDEVLTQLDQTTLPSLYGFEPQGDERECVGASKGGTDCTESLALVATIAGDRTIGPVTLDAIDGTTRRPSRFGSNVVTLHVTPDPFAVVGPALAGTFDVLALIARLLLLLVAVVLIVIALRWLFSRARRPASDMFAPQPAPQAPQGPRAPPIVAAPEGDFDDRYRAALAALRERPTRANVIAVRALVRERCGAGERETLGDLLARDATRGDATLASALRAIDRAAFVEDARLGETIVAAYPALERVAGARA